MKKIKYIMLACLLTASLSMEAKSMKDLLVSMPDEMMPTLNSNMRLEFAELQEMGVKAEVKNLLGEVHIHLRSLCVNMLTIFYIKSAVIVLCVIGSMLA